MRIKFFQSAVFIVGVFSLLSCSRLPIYKINHGEILNRESELNPSHIFYDKKENLSLAVSEDKTNLYMQTVFHNRESLMKIMRGGLIIYFDPQGKKKKDYMLKIERGEGQQSGYERSASTMEGNMQNRQLNMSSAIARMLNKVTWNKAGKEFVFYRDLLKDPIEVDFSSSKENELQLNIRIPKDELPFKTDQQAFSLGIESGTAPSSGQVKSGMQGNGMSRGGGMRPGGGMGRAGGPGAGMRGGGGGMPQKGTSSSAMSPIRIWLHVQM